jgi:sulfopropanediol 3-dehydrogenase
MKIVSYSELDDDYFKYLEIGEFSAVQKIVSDVKNRGDQAVKEYTLKFDNTKVEHLRIDRAEVASANNKIDNKVIATIKEAAENLRRFATKQRDQLTDFEFEIRPGVFTGQKVIPIKRIGVYVPAGRFPLPSSVLMGCIPARVAGVEDIVLCSPPTHEGSFHPAILVTADIAGVDVMYKVGGAQAIAAMAFGTETIKPVDKIVGPGNKYVTAAKKLVYGTVGIDFIAGPTEVMIIADHSANPAFIAADLLAQAEHDTNAAPILVTDSLALAEQVNQEIDRQLAELKTAQVARQAISNQGVIIHVDSINEAIEVANKKAPEHLELQFKNADDYMDRFKNYGSLFIGEYSVEALGDYTSGLNHTLPTNTCARYTGGLSVMDFVKIQTTLRVTPKGISSIGPGAKHFGEIEGLDGHAKSVGARLESM